MSIGPEHPTHGTTTPTICWIVASEKKKEKLKKKEIESIRRKYQPRVHCRKPRGGQGVTTFDLARPSAMAPLEHQAVTNATNDSFAATRDSMASIDSIDSQTLAVMCVSLSFATISVIAALFAFYWFIRMRRGFRQE